MYPPSTRTRFGGSSSSSRRSSVGAADVPLTAERAMMDQIRSKLERAQRRLARNSPSSSGSVTSSSTTRYMSSSEHNSKSPVKSVLLEDMPATASKHYAPPPSTMRQAPPSRRSPPPPSSRRPPRSKYDSVPSSRYAQYESRSKYSQGSLVDADPLNGGPPPMSAPYLVYSNSVPHTTGSNQQVKSTRREKDERQRVTNTPPSAMRSGIARPPSSRVRFDMHESERRASIDKTERDNNEMEKNRRHQQVKDRETRHHRHRGELKHLNAQTKGPNPTSPIAAETRGRRSTSAENPPSSAIKPSAYKEIAQAIPTSPVGRPRRSSISNPPPKSDIKISAFDDAIPRRRSSQEKQSKPEHSKAEAVIAPEVVSVDTRNDQKVVVQVAVVKSPPPSVIPEPDESTSSSDAEGGYMSAYETDDSYDYEFSDFETDSEHASPERLDIDDDVTKADLDSHYDEDNQVNEANMNNQDTEDEKIPIPSATDMPTVKEDDDEEPQRLSRLTARDLALHALGRASTCSLSDLGSPVPSANGKYSPTNVRAVKMTPPASKSITPAPMSYTPASSAFPSACALGRRAPATTGRTRNKKTPPPVPSTSVSSYVRRSRARAPMDLKNHLPPSIGVLSGLSSGSSTFAMDPSYFYDVTWKSGEFAFSVQRVYTDENEYEFDDRNQEPQLFLRMLLNTERSTCKSFSNVRVGDVLIRVGDTYVSDLGLEGSGTVLTKFFAKLMAQTPIRLTFQRMASSEWEGGVEL